MSFRYFKGGYAGLAFPFQGGAYTKLVIALNDVRTVDVRTAKANSKYSEIVLSSKSVSRAASCTTNVYYHRSTFTFASSL